MRGVAAIAVVLLHVSFFDGVNFAPGGDLAVDFFFALSGFVLARAYRDQLLSGLSSFRFVELRFVRLYPLFFLGVLFGVAKEMARIEFHTSGSPRWLQTLAALSTNPLMLPAPDNALLFPLDVPAWSLFFELLINGVWAVALVKASRRVTLAVAIISAIVLAFGAVRQGTMELGPYWRSFIFGLARVGFSFPIGLLLADAFGRRDRKATYLAFVPIALLIAVLAFPEAGKLHGLLGPLLAIAVLPGILWCAACWDVPKRLEKAAAFLGDVSYPIYAVHYPLLIIFAQAQRRVMHGAPVLLYLAFVVGVVGVAAVLARCYDAPVRSRISRWLHLTQPSPRPA